MDFSAITGVITDMDGVLWRGDVPLPGLIAFSLSWPWVSDFGFVAGYAIVVRFTGVLLLGLGAIAGQLAASLVFDLALPVGIFTGLAIFIPYLGFGLGLILALLYVFEWLGYQEVAMPMRREAPALYMQFADARVLSMIAGLLLVAAIVASPLPIPATASGSAISLSATSG